MKKFKFSFEKLIFKKKKEAEEIQRGMLPLVKKHNYYLDCRRNSMAELRAFKSESGVAEVNMQRNFFHQAKNNQFLRKIDLVIEKSWKELAPWQAKLQKKMAEVKALEIIQDKKYLEWQKMKRKKEQLLLEETVHSYR